VAALEGQLAEARREGELAAARAQAQGRLLERREWEAMLRRVVGALRDAGGEQELAEALALHIFE
jgi:hypothetical protein